MTALFLLKQVVELAKGKGLVRQQGKWRGQGRRLLRWRVDWAGQQLPGVEALW